MEPYRTHQQFTLSPRQRALLVPLVHDIRAGLLQERAKAADREPGYRTPLEPLDLLLQEAAKLSYNRGSSSNGADLHAKQMGATVKHTPYLACERKTCYF